VSLDEFEVVKYESHFHQPSHRTGDYYAYDGAAVCPPDCLLPEPGMTSYQDIVAYGRRVDPENFRDVVFRQAQVSFLVYTYYYQRAIPLRSDYPIGIEVDLGPEKHLKAG
jgi:hypothetical protein